MRALVTAASRHGATSEIGMAIAEELRRVGVEADYRPAEEGARVEDYDAVVLGSAVYLGRWLEPARRIAERSFEELRARPVWLFSSGPVGIPLTPTEEAEDPIRIFRQLGARDHPTFAGRLRRSELGWVEGTIAGMTTQPEGDFRDWDAIVNWARQIAASLTD